MRPEEAEAIGLVVAIIVAIICGIIGAAAGSRRGAGGIGFLVGFFLGPIGLIVMFMIGLGKKCPFCRKKIHNEAIVCPHCQRNVVPVAA